MKKLYYAIMFLFILGLSNHTNVQAQKIDANDKSALLYEVTGNGLEKPSYVFGTIHIVCSQDMISMKKFSPYIEKTDQVVMELDLDNAEDMQTFATLTKLPEGKTLEDYLTKEQYASVDKMTRKVLSTPLDSLKGSHPIVLLSSLYQSKEAMGCSPPGSYELSFLQYAMSKGKPIEGLETVAMQMDSLNSVPLKKQAKDIYEVSVNQEKFFNDMKNMVKTYKTQSSNALYSFLKVQIADNPQFQTDLLDKRNINWIPLIEKAVKEKPSFIAVGAGHLGGKNGVVKLLRDKGYKLKPIRF